MRILLLTFFLFPVITYAQYSLKGKVLDPQGKPLHGATVRIENSSSGAFSDQNGEFQLSISDTVVVLDISFLGFQTKRTSISLPISDMIEIILLPNENNLEEVTISTGYQVLSPHQTTGSFSKTSNSLLNRRISTDLISRLEDLSPGLVFNKGKGAAARLLIRGQHTINSSSAPLIVIDNFPYEGDINNINPNDVESVTILKDASAASIWGARAGNGVLVITTKNGKSNTSNITFNSNFTFGNLPDIFYQKKMSTADFIEIEKQIFAAGGYSAAMRSANKYPLTPVAELLNSVAEGQVTQHEADQKILDFLQQDVRNDYMKYLYQNSLNQQYSLGVNGGNSTASYYLSAGYDNNRTSLIGNKNERYTFNLSNDLHINNRLQVKNSVYYVENHVTSNNPGIPTYTNPLTGSSGTRMYPYARLVDNSGEPIEVIKQYRLAFLQEKQSLGFLNWGYSPLRDLEDIEKASTTKDLRLNVSGTYSLGSALSLQFLYQFNSGETIGNQLYGEQSYFTRNEINRFTQTDISGKISRPIPIGAILDQSLNTYRLHNPRFLANYNKAFGNKHNILGMVGFEVLDYLSSGSTGRLYGYNPEYGSSRIVDYTTVFLSSINPRTSFRIENKDSRNETIDRYISYYANAAYTYKNRYTLSLSARRDLSNLFGVASNQKGVPLWSAGLAWNLANEEFYKITNIPYLKLRATFGSAGNSNKSVSAYTTAAFSTGVDGNTGLPYATIINPPNPSLRWERVNTLNFGLDFETSNRFLRGSIDYYFKAGYDLIGTTPYPGSSGVKILTGNYAQTRGHGMDAQVIASWFHNIVSWNTIFNLSYVTDRVTRYDMTSTSTLYLGAADGSATLPLEGRPLYSIYSLAWAGLDSQTGDPMGYINGEPDKNYSALLNIPTSEMIYHGPARPKISGAIINTFGWKGLSLSVNVNYRLGYYFRRSSVSYRDVLTANLAHADYENRWRQPGDELITSVPSKPSAINDARDTFYSFSQPLVGRGDHIRLQDINLSYQSVGTLSKKLALQSIQFFLYLNNVGILWKADSSGLDPDFYFSDFRPPLTTSVGVKATF